MHQISLTAQERAAKKRTRTSPLGDTAIVHTIRDFVPIYLDFARLRQAPTTFRESRRLAEILVEVYGDLPLASLTPVHVLAIHKQIGEDEGTPTQANRLRSVISQLCILAEQNLLRPAGSNPTRCVPAYPEVKKTDHVPQHLRRPLVEACRRLVLDRAIDVAAGALLQLMLLVGLRWSDARFLRWEEIRVLGRGRRLELHLSARGPRKDRSKGGERRIPLGVRATELLTSMPRHSIWWAPNPRTGLPYTEIRKQRARVFAAAGIADTGYHQLRHTVGTAGAEAGLSTAQIAALLGHASPSSAERYIHIAGEPAAAAASVMEAAILGGDGDERGDGCAAGRVPDSTPGGVWGRVQVVGVDHRPVLSGSLSAPAWDSQRDPVASGGGQPTGHQRGRVTRGGAS